MKVQRQVTDRGAGTERVRLLDRLSQPPPRTTLAAAHGLTDMQGVIFYSGVAVTDPDVEATYTFLLSDTTHCPCFNIGVGADGSPLLSWSRLNAVYQLPDGSLWAEHENFYDLEDLQAHFGTGGARLQDTQPKDLADSELVRIRQQAHSPVHNIEYESWVYPGTIPKGLSEHVVANAYAWRYSSDLAFNFIQHF